MPYDAGDRARARDAAAARARYQRAASAPPSKRAREFPEEDEDDAQDAADALHSLRLAGAQLGARARERHAHDALESRHRAQIGTSFNATDDLYARIRTTQLSAFSGTDWAALFGALAPTPCGNLALQTVREG